MLFDNLPRTPRKKLMHVVDAGMPNSEGLNLVNMECGHCGYDHGWSYRSETVTQLKRGILCPQCNTNKE